MMKRADLPAYLDRIGLAAAPAPDAAGLAAVQRAHRLAIPFENLDIPLGRGISLDPDHLFDKIVKRRRGGYCFEQNSLFARALATLGFVSRPLLARVWLGVEGVAAKTHTLNLVTIGGADWIADAGFGGGYTPPMPLAEGAEAAAPDGARHRLRMEPLHGWMLERRGDDLSEWQPQYSFTLASVFPADLALANHWTATAPESRFVLLRIANRALPAGFVSLMGRQLTRHDRGSASVTTIASPVAYRDCLRDAFGIALSQEDAALLFGRA